MKKFFLLLLLVLLACLPFSVTRAQFGDALNTLDSAVGTKSGTGLSSDFAGSISTVIKGILALVGTIFFVLTIYAGILWMTARGDDKKVEKSIDIIRSSIIGLAVTLAAYSITYFVTVKLGGGSTNPNSSLNSNTLGCCMSRDQNNPICASGIKLGDCAASSYWNVGDCPATCKK